MGEVLSALFACMLVLVLVIVASGVAMWLLTRSIRQKAVSQQVELVPMATDAALAAGLSMDDAVQLRNVVLRTVVPQPEEVYYLARRRYPDATPDALAAKIIAAEAQKCGFIGFMTGFPGVVALPVTLPIDLYATGRLQASMIQALVYVYASEIDPDELARMKWMVLLGGGSLANSLTQFLIKVVGGSTVRAFPIVGAVAGYAANYFLAQAAGRAAQAHFSGALARVDTGKLITDAQEGTRRLSATTTNLVRALPERLPLPLPTTAGQPTELLRAREAGTPAQAVTYAGESSTPLPHKSGGSGREERVSEPTEGSLDAVSCPICAQPNPASYRFCAGCGSQLERDRP